MRLESEAWNVFAFQQGSMYNNAEELNTKVTPSASC